MGIQIYHLLGETPDRVVSAGDDDEKRFIWSFKDKKKDGIEVRIEPCASDDCWVARLFKITWDGSEFVVFDEQCSECVHDSISDCITGAEHGIQSLCDKNSDLVPCQKLS